jgi:hypothetical protein
VYFLDRSERVSAILRAFGRLRSCEVGLVAVLGATETGSRILGELGAEPLAGCLVDWQCRRVVVRAVIGQQTLSAKAEQIRITDAVSSTNHRSGKRLIRETKARFKVFVIWVDQRTVGK